MNETFEKMSLKELQTEAKNLGIRGISGYRKKDLIERISAYEETVKAEKEKNSSQAVNNTEKSETRKEFSRIQSYEKSCVSKERLKDNSRIYNQISGSNMPNGSAQAHDPESYARGILEVLPDGFGFIRSANFMPGEHDVYVPNALIKKMGLRTGDIIEGIKKRNRSEDKFMALVFVSSVNDTDPIESLRRKNFEHLTPIYPNMRIHLERKKCSIAARIIDLISPIGKGQRGMIVSPPKAGKTTLLKEVANAITVNNKEMYIMILLVDERPEEVTDIKESIQGKNVEVIYSTFDEQPEHHKRVSEMVIERAKRLVEQGKDVTILLDSITRLARAYNLTVQPSGRTLSGGLDPAALHMPKRFFGAARNVREGGSLTILATALIDTGSKMDDVVFEEFKGTGNMELVLDRKLQEKRIFPAIDLAKSGTRRDDLLLSENELAALDIIHKGLNGLKTEEVAERILDLFAKTKDNEELVSIINARRYV